MRKNNLSNHSKQSVLSSGFTLVEVLLVVVVVVLVGLVGYNLYNLQTTQDQATTPNQTAKTAISAPAINSRSDLNKAATTLDSTPEAMSEAELSQLENLASF